MLSQNHPKIENLLCAAKIMPVRMIIIIIKIHRRSHDFPAGGEGTWFLPKNLITFLVIILLHALGVLP